MNTKQPLHHREITALEILKAAAAAFEEATGCAIRILKDAPAGKQRPDAVVRIEPPEGPAKEYVVEIKAGLTPATLGHAAQQVHRFEQPGILVTRRVGPPMAERLKKMDIGFIDTAGNAYINDPPLFIYVTGRKKTEPPFKIATGRAFRPTGLKVVFALLCRPELVNAPYRDIVALTGVAQGTVGWVINDLKQQNFLTDRGKYGRKLTNAPKLLDAWVEHYARELRPKLYIGRYTTKKTGWWKHMGGGADDACLGGEPAAAVLTDYLQPERITVYVPDDINTFLLTHQLKKDPDGEVELLKKFWAFDYPWDHPGNYPGIAPPLLVYADLMATGNDRNIEAGGMIHEKFIHRFIDAL